MKNRVLLILLVSVSFLFTSCVVKQPVSTNIRGQMNRALMNGIYNNQKLAKKAHKKLPVYLTQALTPGLTVNLPGAGKAHERSFNISVNDIPAHDFFVGLVKNTNKSIMVSPKITGSISLSLKNVTVPEVLNAVRDVYGYEYETTAYGYKILPQTLRTRMFTVNYLDVKRSGKSDTMVSSGEISSKIKGGESGSGTSSGSTTRETKPSSSVETTSEADFWKSLSGTAKAIIGEEKGASVIINPQAGLVIVRAYPRALREVAKYLDSIQNIMIRQVIIEAKVLEVELKANYQAGINWNILGLKQEGYKDFPEEVGISAFANIFKLGISHGGDFSTVINLLNAQGRVNVLSSPRISTLNNQKAVIKVGKDQFFVTNVESNTTAGTATAETSQDIDFTPFFSGIALDVTPQIDANGDVILHIHPIVSKVTEEDKEFTVSDKHQKIPLARSDIRETDSIVRAKNGQVIVIGGLMEDRSSQNQASVPLADKLPGISELFKSPNKFASKFELIILLKPIVVGNNTWNSALKREAFRVRSLPNDFSYSAKIKTKGAMAR